MTGLKKNLELTSKEKKLLIDHANKSITITRQAELLGIARSTVYYEPVVDLYDLELMRFIDEQYTKTPFYGSRRMTVSLNRNGYLNPWHQMCLLLQTVKNRQIRPGPCSKDGTAGPLSGGQ